MKIDSSLTLQKMNFVQIEEVPEMVNVNKNPNKKFNSEKLKKKNKSSSWDSNSNKKQNIKINIPQLRKRSLFLIEREILVRILNTEIIVIIRMKK